MSTALAAPDDIAAAVLSISALPPSSPATLTARRTLARRARALSLTHLVPPQWLRPPAHSSHSGRKDSAPPAALTAAAPPADADPLTAFAARTGLPAPAVRAAYMRAVRDYAMTSPHLRPPPELTRDMIACARASSLARRALGDPTARSDDDDLLAEGSVR